MSQIRKIYAHVHGYYKLLLLDLCKEKVGSAVYVICSCFLSLSGSSSSSSISIISISSRKDRHFPAFSSIRRNSTHNNTAPVVQDLVVNKRDFLILFIIYLCYIIRRFPKGL